MFKKKHYGEDDNSGSSASQGLSEATSKKAKSLTQEVESFLDQEQELEEERSVSMCCGCNCR